MTMSNEGRVEIDEMFSFCGCSMVYRGLVNPVQSKPFQACELLALQACSIEVHCKGLYTAKAFFLAMRTGGRCSWPELRAAVEHARTLHIRKLRNNISSNWSCVGSFR